MAATWTLLSPAHSPGTREAALMCLDEVRDEVILFGGDDGVSVFYTDTWRWDGTDWTHLTPSTSPAALTGSLVFEAVAMAWDGANGKILLATLELLTGGVTWELRFWHWDGSDWAEVTPATTRPTANSCKMVYDRARDQVVLLLSDDFGYTHNTWTWDGTDWADTAQTLQPGGTPSKPRAFSIEYDEAQSKVVYYGGRRDVITAYTETWLWDGSSWAQDSTANNPGVDYSFGGQYLAWSWSCGGVVLIFDTNSGTISDDSWIYHDVGGGVYDWELQSSSGPTQRQEPAMCRDQDGGVLVFGGHSGPLLNDTWRLMCAAAGTGTRFYATLV